MDGFDDERFKSYYRTFDYVLNRLGSEVDALNTEVSHAMHIHVVSIL